MTQDYSKSALFPEHQGTVRGRWFKEFFSTKYGEFAIKRLYYFSPTPLTF